MPALRTESVTAGYGRAPIINDISLTADTGLVTTIVGPNGAGKSTFAKTLVGILKPMSGRIARERRRHHVDAGPPDSASRPRLRAAERQRLQAADACARTSRSAGSPRRATPLRAWREILEIFTDLGKATREEGGLPLGRPAEPARDRAGAHGRPAVIVLDEPTAGLSPAYTDVVWNQIARISQLDTAVLVVEQNVERALKHSDYVHVFVAGRSHVHGPATEIAALDLASIFLGRSHAS